ncbi:hypothetical protein, partial [Mucilaginibacter sp. OK098]|uniref:hypothetical protein n=1 Tax=Mucilaginibacter sp. OK098 TaxID=1855297 RepID=UPI0009131215
MKHFLITIITFLSFTITCSAQWTTSGSSIIPIPAYVGFNVGIGTATPAASSLLQVQKNTNGPTISTVVNNDPGANAKASFIVGSVPGTGLPGGTFG